MERSQQINNAMEQIKLAHAVLWLRLRLCSAVHVLLQLRIKEIAEF